jgi:hypothetical protein
MYRANGCYYRTAMIDTLVASSTSMESVTVHFFCDYADQKTLYAVEIFGSLAKQLLSAFKRIPEEMEKMIRNAYGDDTLIPDASTVLEILLAAVKLFSRVYIVLDGVDECRGEDRLEVIAAIRTMSSADPEKSALRLFVSSRGDVDIERALEYSIHLQVNAENISPDIKSFIAGIIKDKEHSGDLSVRDPGLLNEIIAVLADKADGMYENLFLNPILFD